MTLVLKKASHNSASHYILLQDFAFKQVLECASTSSSCTISQKKMDMMVFFQ